jgi:hypothetical protein
VFKRGKETGQVLRIKDPDVWLSENKGKPPLRTGRHGQGTTHKRSSAILYLLNCLNKYICGLPSHLDQASGAAGEL